MVYIRRYNNGVFTIIKKDIITFYSYRVFMNYKEMELWSINPVWIYNDLISKNYNFRFKILRNIKDFFNKNYEDIIINEFKQKYGAELI